MLFELFVTSISRMCPADHALSLLLFCCSLGVHSAPDLGVSSAPHKKKKLARYLASKVCHCLTIEYIWRKFYYGYFVLSRILGTYSIRHHPFFPFSRQIVSTFCFNKRIAFTRIGPSHRIYWHMNRHGYLRPANSPDTSSSSSAVDTHRPWYSLS